MKKYLSIFLLVFFLLPLYSKGAMAGQDNVQVVKTTWFDIIFPEASLGQAQRLAQVADSIYQEIADEYGYPPQFRLPVVITPAVEQHNGYYSQAFYNHIVLYDAQPSVDMDIFSDSLISTFRHELTHAYTYNMKNGFWKGVGTLFGDTVNPGHLLITRGWAEGATLTMESFEGEGRMNCGYSLQMVRQAAIEGQFPDYDSVQGARTTYPAGSFYNFNGSFNQWLQDKFGMEKYAQFWHGCINFKSLTVGGVFKKVYGVSLNKAWKNFQQDIEDEWSHVAEKSKDFFSGNSSSGNCSSGNSSSGCDFFEPNQEGFSIKNRAGSRFTSLVASDTASEKRFFWIDAASSTIYKATVPHSASSQNKKPKVKRLATIDGINQIKPSCDGRFLLASVYSQGAGATRLQLWLLDLETEKWHKISSGGKEIGTIVAWNKNALSTGSQEGVILSNEESLGEQSQHLKEPGHLVFSTKYKNGASAIVVDSLVMEGKKIQAKTIYEGDYQPNTYYRDFVVISESQNPKPTENQNPNQVEEKQKDKTNTIKLTFIKSKEGKQSIYIYDFASQLLQEISLHHIELPSQWGINPSIRNLSYQSETNSLVFSWAAKNTLPRLGIFNLKTGQLLLQTIDVSGGIHHPILVSDYSNNKDTLVYTGKFYTHNKLLQQSLEKLKLEVFSTETFSTETFSTENSPTTTNQDSTTNTSVTDSSVTNTSVLPNSTFAPLVLQQDKTEFFPETAFLPTTAYKPFQYYNQGVFLPLALNLNLPYYGKEDGRTIGLPAGLTWMTSNPWLMGVLVASVGYGIDTKSFAYNLSYENGTHTKLFQYGVSHGSEFDLKGEGWLHSTATVKGSSSIPLHFFPTGSLALGGPAWIKLGNTAQFQFGKPYFHFINSSSLNWDWVHQWGPGSYEKLGFTLALELYYTLNTSLNTGNINHQSGNLGLGASLYLPKLLPITNLEHHTYNLPTTITAQVFPSSLASNSLLGGSSLSYSWGKEPKLDALVAVETILYSINIQKALPLVTAVFVNNFTLSVTGKLGFQDKTSDDASLKNESWRLFKLPQYFSQLGSPQVPVEANIALRASLGLTPNIGFSAYPNLGGNLYFEFTTAGLTRDFVPVFRLGLVSRW